MHDHSTIRPKARVGVCSTSHLLRTRGVGLATSRSEEHVADSGGREAGPPSGLNAPICSSPTASQDRPYRRFVCAPRTARVQACLQNASASDVPICAAVQDGAGRRSGTLFGARVGALDRRLGCGRRCRQHRLPNAVPCTAQPRQATSLLAPVTAPGTISSRHDGGSNYQ